MKRFLESLGFTITSCRSDRLKLHLSLLHCKTAYPIMQLRAGWRVGEIKKDSLHLEGEGQGEGEHKIKNKKQKTKMTMKKPLTLSLSKDKNITSPLRKGRLRGIF